MSTSTYLQSRAEASGLSAVLLTGDLLAIGGFVAAGRLQHLGTPIGDPTAYVETLVPFLVGWAVAAVLGGLYTRDAVLFPRRAVGWTLPAWVVTVVVAMALRATPQLRGGVAPTFVVVTLLVGGVLVLGWRVLAAAYTNKRA
jgi:hypothetical protein